MNNNDGIETFKFKVKVFIKGEDGKCISHVFKEGWEPGVIATQEISFDVKPCDLKSPMFEAELMHKQDEFRDAVVGTTIEQILEKNKKSS